MIVCNYKLFICQIIKDANKRLYSREKTEFNLEIELYQVFQAAVTLYGLIRCG